MSPPFVASHSLFPREQESEPLRSPGQVSCEPSAKGSLKQATEMLRPCLTRERHRTSGVCTRPPQRDQPGPSRSCWYPPSHALVLSGLTGQWPGTPDSRSLWTEVYDLFQRTFAAKLCQRGSDSLNEGSRDHEASLLVSSHSCLALFQQRGHARTERSPCTLGDAQFSTRILLAAPSASA